MRGYIKKILSLLLIATLLAPSVFGLENNYKEEVIYSKLDFSGKAEFLIVVNGFPKSFRGSDYGNYTQVTNLSTSDELAYDGEKLKIHAKENFYYQGKLDDGILPWLISMDWKLDGKKVGEEELLGATGHLELIYEIRKNPRAQGDYFDYYVVQSSFQFDVDQINNLLAPEGTLAAAGSTKMVNFMSLPGRGGTYKLSADVTNYEPGMVQVAALPLNLDFDISELSEYTQDLKTLELAIAELNGGTQDFINGLYQLKEGSGSFGRGGEEILEGSGDLSSGLLEISEGSGEFSQGLASYSQGMEDFRDGVLELTSGLDEMAGGVGELSTGSKELRDGVDQLAQGLRLLVVKGKGGLGDELEEPENLVSASEQFLSFFSLLGDLGNIEIDEGDVEIIARALSFINERLIPLITSIDRESLEALSELIRENLVSLGSSINNLTATRDALLNPPAFSGEGDEDLVAQVAEHYENEMYARAQEISQEITRLTMIEGALEVEKALVDLFINSLPAFEEGFIEFQELLGELQKILEELEFNSQDIQELLDNLRLLSGGYKLFHEGLVQYVDGVEEVYQGVAGNQGLAYGMRALSSGLGELASGMNQFSQVKKELEKGVSELSSGASLFYENYLELNSGLRQLALGLRDFDLGLGQYVHGFWSLHSGLEELYKGGKKLASGTALMREETRDIDKKMEEEIKMEIESLSAQGIEFGSFVSPKNKRVSSVQFVLLYEGRSLPQEEIDNNLQEEKNFWDRFIDLFRKKD